SDFSIRIASVQTSSVVFDISDGNFTITPNEITVTSPNGGEIWRTVVPQTITWNDNLIGSVKIELYQGGQDPGDLHSVLTSSTPSNGSFLWNVTTDVVPADDYQIKITSNLDNNVFDFSDTTFTFIKEITVLSPNGGEAWLVGSTQTIGWTDNITERVAIDLFKSDTLYTIIEFSTTSDGSYNWIIPDSTTPGSDYKIKITSVDDPDVFDFSDNNFTIVGFSITVLSPNNGNEAWLVGSQQTIKWTDNFPGNVSIDLFKSDTLYTIIDFSTGSDGSNNWDIPDSTTPGSDYKIKISSVDDPGVFDFSDNNFTVVGFNITVTSPNGGEEWLISDRRDIVWTDNIDENVKIDLYKGGLFHSTIDFSSSGADEVQPWDIPLSGISQGENYRIRITSVDDSTLFDFSDGDFTLFLSKITVTSPNGGEIWQAGTRHTITWTDVINENVQIDLYRSDTLYSPISPSTSSDGAFTWNIPAQTEAGFDYKIMMKSTINDIIFDLSDDNFTIKTVPDDFILSQNYPNPFNPSTTIRYGIPEDGRVLLEVFDITGQKLFTLVDEEKISGFHEVSFENSVLPSGVYFYRIVAGKFVDFKKMILSK
ncbi:MAG: Ser-Thr-rich GPI-anchored membrane family protein, partial [Calditrichia bacterium]